MKFYLLKYEIRDGENEYDDCAIIKTDKKMEDGRIFKKFVKENWGRNLERVGEDKYTVDGDYRIISLYSIREITTAQRQVLADLSVGGYNFEL